MPREPFPRSSLPPDSRQFPSIVGTAVLISSLLIPGIVMGQSGRISPSGLAQIQTLLDEKSTWTVSERKVDSALLLALKKRQGDSLFDRLPDLRPRLSIDRQDRVLVDIRAEVSAGLLAQIETLGGEVVNSFPRYRAIRARLPAEQLLTLAAMEDVEFIRQAETFELHKLNTSEGDAAHAADTARTVFGVSGTGVNVGVISDSIEALGSLQTSGDLPAVTVLPGQAGSGISEGTAMLEIVHDLAPGAGLFFATAQGGQAAFAQNILDLQAAGCDVIVDDIRYFAEPVFQDGIIADAVDQVTAAGVQYFASAGNSGNLNDGTAGVWQGDFSSATPPSALSGFDTNDFGGGDSLNTITVDSPSFFTLHWTDAQGASGNDYDLILLDQTGSTVVDVGANTQNGDDNPFEQIDSRVFNDTGLTLAVVRFSGAGRFLHLNSNRGELEFATDGQTSGHNSAAGAFGVAAVDQATSGGFAFTGGVANPVELFSSDGPRRVFFRADGSAITPGDFSSTGGELRQKPDIAAADGVATATPGFNPFFGTSAAAPHAAAIAALMQENANLTTSGMRQVFSATALDIEAPGVDRDSGYGIVMGVATVGTTTSGPAGCQVNHLMLSGVPNDGPQTFRACNSMTVGDGTFNDVTGIAPTIIFTDGFESGNTSSWGPPLP